MRDGMGMSPCKIMVNLLSKNRPDPATLNMGAGGLTIEKVAHNVNEDLGIDEAILGQGPDHPGIAG